ncbi:hypothetical protein [Halococcus sp. IIIV-5B]|uniref:hypothetical protein n=1 Tax=Halococcus sp. IIIV-5B TaxID=2321230 RepID=UPI000E70F113|nr:hypothetical protein [Halococcus sp. IIIV-5B]RJS97055.1 hypothetical protein D3261_18475 [Halococcus sp. IIIV-5B]
MATDGDIRVLVAIDLVLSTIFSTLVVWGLSFVGSLTFSWVTVGLATLLLALVTYLAVLR